MLNLPHIGKGDPITARWLNRLVDVIRSLRIVTDGSILVDHTPGGQVLRVNGGATGGGWIGRSGVGGVPAMSVLTPGSATVTIYSFAGTALTVSGTATAYHTGASPVAGDVVIQGKFVDGKRVIDWEDCPEG